jgi:FkbM family methyltransferase
MSSDSLTRRLRTKVKLTLAAYPQILGPLKAVYHSLGFGMKTEDDYLYAVARRRPGAFVLQVGAMDGQTDDFLWPFIRHYRWRGVLMEPMQPLFEKLRNHYRTSRGIIFENRALAEADGPRTFFRVRPAESIPDWCAGWGSFRREILENAKNVVPAIEGNVLEETIECVSLGSLVNRHAIERIDVVVIDVEGYDYTVLKQIDFGRFRPDLIIYEQTHLNAEEKASAIALLVRNGYRVDLLGMNNAAVRI